MCRSYKTCGKRGGVDISTEPGRHACRCWRGAEGAARCCAEPTQKEVQRGWRGWLERPAVPEDPGAHQRVLWTAASSETRPGERTWLVQPVSEPLPSKGRAHAKEVPVEGLDRELCQRQHKCRKAHHRLLHVDAEGERSPQTARPAKPAELPDRSGRSPAHSRAKASRHVSAGTPEVAATQRKSRKHGSGADSGRRAATPVAICAALRVMPVASTARETAQPAEASEGEAARRRSGGGRPQQQQRSAGKQRTAAGRCEREQIG
jgi:hypothetical protein